MSHPALPVARRRPRRPAASATRAAGAAALAVMVLAGCTKGGDAGDAQPPGSAPGTTSAVPGTAAPSGSGSAAPTTTRPATTSPRAAQPPVPSATDWQNTTYPRDACATDDTARPDNWPADGYAVRNGESPHATYGGPLYIYDVDVVARGDLTGDGKDDAVVRLGCTGGTNGWGVAWLYDGSAPAPRRLGRVALPEATMRELGLWRADLVADPASIEGGALHTDWAAYRDDDPNCCPSSRAIVTLRWTNGGEWRVEGTPALLPAH